MAEATANLPQALQLKGVLTSAPFMLSEAGNYSRHQLLSAAYRLAQTLPEAPLVMNLYTQRDCFLTVLLAVAMRGGKTLLPPSVAKNTLADLSADVCRREGQPLETVSDTQAFAAGQTPKDFFGLEDLPESILAGVWEVLLDAEIWLFTSGSTGRPKKVVKTWRQMALLAQQAIARFDLQQPGCVVATVPSQHMFGLETTIFWPLFSRQSVWSGRPMFAEDIKSALAAQDGQAWLISTPLHLQKILPFDLVWPSRGLRVLSATAPLDSALAQQVSERLQARVFEVFGSTETASIASRETMTSEAWVLYEGNHLLCAESLSVCEVHIAPLAQSYPLHDRFELVPDRPHCFRLLGRRSDVVKVAGKRSSLATLNQTLQRISGVEDGIFWQPPGEERLQAFVVSALRASDIKRALVQDMDPVFLPRPIHFVETIPRNALGKIPFEALKALAEKVEKPSAADMESEPLETARA